MELCVYLYELLTVCFKNNEPLAKSDLEEQLNVENIYPII